MKTAFLILLATLAFAVAPYLSAPFTGYDPAAFPVRIERPAVQPAGYAFAIWGLIYLGLLAHAVFGLIARADHPDWQRPRLPLLAALVLGSGWIALALFDPLIATAVILLMAGTAIMAFLRATPTPDFWALSAPLALFAGWLTAASAVSVGVLVAGYGLLSNSAAALVMMALAVALSLLIQRRNARQPLYSAAVVWALIGIAVANGTALPLVTGAAVLAALLVGGMALRRA
ncbi:seryl-tRNA synthetase [Paracoccaceae bacterium]